MQRWTQDASVSLSQYLRFIHLAGKVSDWPGRADDRYGDPGFHRHVDAAKILGLLCRSNTEKGQLTVALRAADSLVLPLNTTQYAVELQYYLEKWVPGWI